MDWFIMDVYTVINFLSYTGTRSSSVDGGVRFDERSNR